MRERERAVLAAAAAVVTTSAWTRRRLGELYGLPADRVHVAEPGVDAAALARGSADGGALLCVAAVTPDKGHDVLLDALAVARDLPWRCECVGSLVRDADHAAGVLRRARRLDGRVHFPGARIGTELDEAYAAADLLVLASRAETYGMVLTEALARGVPVLAADVGGVREALGHGEDGTRPGLLIPPGDPVALGDALRAWLGDAGLRARLRRAARERRGTLRRWTETTSVGRAGRWHDRRQPGVARPARAGRRGGALGGARRAPRTAPSRRAARGPRPRRRQRRDGPLARAAAARAAALGGPRPGRDPAGARRRRPARRGRGDRRGEGVRHHAADAGGPRRRGPRRRLGAARPADRRRAGRDARRLRAAVRCCSRSRSSAASPSTPADPLDAALAAAFDDHQRRGRLLGPDAVAAAVDALATGAEVVVRPSPWRLGAAQAELTAAWLDGWVAAATEQEPALADAAGAYRDRRLEQLAAGELAVVVDHADLLVLP